jgi:glycosyltransferase involved in cell wall biosynthesis
VRTVVVCKSDVSGGAERHMCLLYRGLADRGNSCYLVGSMSGWKDVGLPSRVVELGPKWGRRNALRNVARLPGERKSVEEIIRCLDGDVFHVQFKREQIGFTKMLSKYGPVIWTEHGRFPRGSGSGLLAAMYRRAAVHVSLIVCVSEEVATDVGRIVGPSVNVRVLPNAINTLKITVATPERRLQARKRFGIGETTRVLAWVGQVNNSKLPLVAAKAGLLFDGTTIMAGTGSGDAEVRKITDGTKVKFLGYQKYPGYIYDAADVFLFTSTGSNEGYPTNTMLEAAAHGLPIVANEGSESGTVVTATGGQLAGDSPSELATIAGAIAGRKDVGIRARLWAESHDLVPWLDKYEKFLRSAL